MELSCGSRPIEANWRVQPVNCYELWAVLKGLS